MQSRVHHLVLSLFVWMTAFAMTGPLFGQTDASWPYYGGDAGGMRYSRLTQIDASNVSNLKVAWVFHTGDVSDGNHGEKRSGFEATPLLVGGTLFFTTGFNRVIALNPATGTQLWSARHRYLRASATRSP